MGAVRQNSSPRNGQVTLKRTDELGLLVRKIVSEYHKDRGEPIGRADLRRRATQLLVEIEKGAAEISLRSRRVDADRPS